MTDRLATLLHGEADTLDVPTAPAPEILAAGHRLRRRRTRVRGGGAVLLAVAVAVTGGVALRAGDHASEDQSATSTDTPTFAYASNDTVFLGEGGTEVTMPEVAQTLYYTSAGLLVRTNRDGSSDGGAPFHFELVTADGNATRLGVTLGEVTPSADPDEPYLAWATMSHGQIQVIVHDVSTDRDVANVDVPGTFDWAGLSAPPVALSGDLVYVGTNDKTEVVNWRTGEATTSDVIPGSTFPSVEGGRLLLTGGDTTKVLDAVSGKVLLQVPSSKDGFADLSPDGRFLLMNSDLFSDQGPPAGAHTEIYDVDSGSKVQVPSSGWGWSSDSSQVFQVNGSTMTTCSTSTGRCQDTTVPAVGHDALVRYAGFAYES
jgi:hypothetical protein